MRDELSHRVLICNVHFAPLSYGGATVVAENMAQELGGRLGWNVLVVTSFYDSRVVPYTMKRYSIGGIEVVAVCVPSPALSYRQRYENPEFDRVFDLILEAFDPHVVHVHCVQDMGASFLAEVKRRDIPLAVTVHDAWWMCERQFMVTPHHKYCHQEVIDLAVCRYCVEDIDRATVRKKRLTELLQLADTVLFPSAFFRNLGVANGLAAERCYVNKNGIVPPGDGYFARRAEKKSGRLRFGFVGGPGPNKGSRQMLMAFRAIKNENYDLVIVDAAQNAGRSWRDLIDWSIPGRLVFHPAYTKQNMDDFFSSIDVLLFPSQWKESFGLTVREALCRDVWVIASDAGGVAEDCAPGINSTIIPMMPDPGPLREAILRILKDPLINGFVNPQKSAVRTVSEQADELSLYLTRMIKPDTAMTKP